MISGVAHLFLLSLLWLHFDFDVIEPTNEKVAPNIQATAVDGAAIKKEIQRRENQQQQKVKQAQQKVERERQAKAKAEQDRKDKIALEKKRKEQKKKEEQEKAERDKQIAEQKKKAEAQKKLDQQLEEKRKLEEQLMNEQLAAEQQVLAAKRQAIMSEVDIFKSRIESKIRQYWNKPEKDGYCLFNLRLGPSGILLGFVILEENGRYCDSARIAVQQAEPFPMSKNSDVIDELRSLNIVLGKRL